MPAFGAVDSGNTFGDMRTYNVKRPTITYEDFFQPIPDSRNLNTLSVPLPVLGKSQLRAHNHLPGLKGLAPYHELIEKFQDLGIKGAQYHFV